MKRHIKLIITIIVIVILIVVAVIIGTKQYKNNDFKNLSTNLLQIQAKAKNIKEKCVVENNENLLIGQEVPNDITENLKIENTNKIRLLTLEDLNMLGLSNIKEDRKYIVDYESGEVYYIDGFKTEEGEVYYNLSGINNIDNK